MAAALSFPDFGHGEETNRTRRFALKPAERPLRVLIVDDEPMIVRLADSILQPTGCERLTTSDPEQALDMARQANIDVLVTDLAMPKLNGQLLAARLRESLPQLKVLYLTGYAAQLFEDRPILPSDEAFLQKPFTSAGLVEAISLLAHGKLSQGRSIAARPITAAS